MQEHEVKQLIEQYIEQYQLDQKTDVLREQIQALEARQGLLNLEQAEEKVESYVKQGLSHEAAFKLVVEELEEKEQKRKARLDEARREKTQVKLEELSPAGGAPPRARGGGRGIVQATTTPPIEELEARVEEIVEELEQLEGQLQDATSQIQRAEKKFAGLDDRRRDLAPRTFAGDDKARVELEGVELEHDEAQRNVRVAEAALPELERMVKESKEKLANARREVHKARASRIYQEVKSVEERRDELADELREALDEHSRLHGDYMAAVRLYSQDKANNLATARPDMYTRWLRKAFSRWL